MSRMRRVALYGLALVGGLVGLYCLAVFALFIYLNGGPVEEPWDPSAGVDWPGLALSVAPAVLAVGLLSSTYLVVTGVRRGLGERVHWGTTAAAASGLALAIGGASVWVEETGSAERPFWAAVTACGVLCFAVALTLQSTSSRTRGQRVSRAHW